jgi:hypothetical protein
MGALKKMFVSIMKGICITVKNIGVERGIE